MSARTPAEVLAESRRRDSHAKRGKVLAVLEEMVRRGEPVSFTAVARAAGVSHWLVYAEGIRERIETARVQQHDKPRRDRQADLNASAVSLATDLQLAREDNNKLRAERDQLKAALRRQLGEQLDQLSHQSLIDRLDELTQHNQQLTAETERLRHGNATLRHQLQAAEEDLAAARTALRRMVHQTNIASNGALRSDDQARPNRSSTPQS
jgi:outer membrane murein-binding lipoprotein Lpp